MSTWDLDTIRKVRGLRMEARVDRLSIASARIAATREKLAKALVDEAHALAVEVHLGDVAFVEGESEDVPFAVRILARWSPQTHEVELCGGHLDGTVMAVRCIDDPIRVPLPPPPIGLVRNDDLYPTAVLESQDFKMVGWSESTRRWVYAAA